MKEFQQDGPIIQSLLDTDHYKLTMGQFAFHRYADVPVKYEFTNRTKKVKLAEIVDEKDLRRELDHVQTLGFNGKELEYLRELKNGDAPLFKEDYVQFLGKLQLPNYKLKKENGDFKIEFPGEWARAIYWETPALAVKNELYYRAIMKNMDPEQIGELYAEGKRRLEEKIRILEQNPDIEFMEFGTRRRFSREWQEYVVETLKERIPNQMKRTSNVNLAMKHGLIPAGTQAHETYMIMSGIMHKNDDEIRASHNQVLKEWFEEYGPGLAIALTDTYGSKFFFNDMTEEQARNWKGLRQDSGNPIAFGKKQLDFYGCKSVDPREKLFVPSDGLDLGAIRGIQDQFRGEIKTLYGWGTNLTNDLGLEALSLVIKATEANGHGTVKLSDNPAKTIGKPKDVTRFMRIFEYNPQDYTAEVCKY